MTWRKQLFPWTLALCFVAGGCGPADRGDADKNRERDNEDEIDQPKPLPDSPFVGKKAFEIEGKDADGKSFKLSDYRGKVVLLDFWFANCGPCMAMVPHQRELVKTFQNQPFALLGVNPIDGPRAAERAIKTKGLIWRNWVDFSEDPRSVTQEWGVNAYPTFFLIDAKGVIRYYYRGGVRAEVLEDKIEKLLDELEKEQK